MIHHKGSLAMYHIYALKCEELVLYVGQTVDLYNRFNMHKNRHTECGSSDIPADIDYYMDLLEIVDTKEEATQREQFFYDTLKPFYNKNRPGQTTNEYNKNNKEKIKEYQKEWNKNNKEYKKEYQKEWRKDNKEYNKEYKREYRRRNK